ncbi:MAG: DNA/RNA non-specific endonuclease [Chthoniobacterales bacterium]
MSALAKLWGRQTSFWLSILLLVATSTVSRAKLGIEFQAPLGNPDSAVTVAASRTNYLIQRAQYALSYNDDTHEANWVGWSYSLSDDGPASRTDAWAVEELLPSGFLKIGTATFGTGWDRGHMCPSADRLKTTPDNEVTFRMSNIIPQASQNNQGLWNNFESYCRTLAADGDEVVIMSGPAQFTGARLANQMATPGFVWKIVVEIPGASSTTPANQRATTGARVIAILTPNVNTGLGTWQSYITSVEAIENVTGLNFFTAMDPSVAIYLKNVIDTGNGPNTPTVLTTFNPTLGPPGSSVVISGYNFGPSPVVAFNGSPASVTAVTSNSITATVPVGATTGAITVTGPGGTDTSYEDFTVTAGTSPIINLSAINLGGLTAPQGAAGPSQIYAVTGSLLTSAVTITASADFEISTDNANFSPNLSLTPAIDGNLGSQIYVRIKSTAPLGALSGSVTHQSPGAATRSLSLSGTVTSASPYLALSTNSLGSFSAVQGSAGASRSYSVSGGNLTGTIAVTASAGYEVSQDGTSFASSQTISPVGGALANVPLYVRLSASSSSGPVSGTISHSGGGASRQDLAVTGSVVPPGSGETAAFAWDFVQATPTPASTATLTVSAVAQGNNNGTTTMLTTASASSGYTGASGTSNAGAAARIGALNTATGGSAYFEFTVTPSAGQTFTFPGLSLGTRSTGTGPQAYALRSSVDNYTTDIVTGSISNNSAWTLKTHANLPGTFSSATTFRLYGYGGTGAPTTSTANWRIDDLKVTVSTAVAVPLAPVITSSSTAFATAHQTFSYQITANNSPTNFAASNLPEGLSVNPTTGIISGTPAAAGTYTILLTASNAAGDGAGTLLLTVAPDPNAPVITSALTASAQVGVAFSYQITASNSPTTYLAANLPVGLDIDPATGTIIGTPTTAGSANVSITASNALGGDTRTLVVTVRAPLLELSSSSLNPFSANLGFASSVQTYTISGSDLSSPVTAFAPGGFEISTDGTTFVDALSFTPNANGTVTATIQARMAAAAPLGENSGSITHTGSGATPKYLALTGTVQATEPTLGLSVTELLGFTTKAGTASFVQRYTVSGANLSGPITITAPAGYELSLDGLTFTPVLTVSPVNGRIVGREVEVRLLATAGVGLYNDFINHTGGGVAPQGLALFGAVVLPVGPPITSMLSGSAYAGGSFSYSITAGGDLPITGYAAANLPSGLTVNPSTGVITGTVAAAGSYSFTISASNADGTSNANYALRVVSAAEQAAQPLSVVINKFQNSSTDAVELLVIGDSTDAASGPAVNLRSMVLKDFASNMGADSGGLYVFKDIPLWSSVKAGTLIVVSSGTTSPEDLDGSDFVLRVNLGNTGAFTNAGGSFDLQNTDMVMIKAAGTGLGGVAGGIHDLAMGSAGSQYSAFTGKKLRSSNSLSSNRTYGYVVNANSNLTDFYSAGGGQAADARSLTFGVGSNTGNSTYIATLRALDQTPPVITLNGGTTVNLTTGTPYIEAGATATDAVNGVRPVTVSGSVNTAVPGNYTITYAASDVAGNTATATRTIVISPAPFSTWILNRGLANQEALPSADPDRDGWSNAQEFAFGLNPKLPDGRLFSSTVAGNVLRVTFLQRMGVSYIVRTSADPAIGFDGVLKPNVAADQAGLPSADYTRYEVSMPLDGPKGFLRVETIVP